MYKDLKGQESVKFQRSGSQICDPPEQDLLKAVLHNENLKIRRILDGNPGLINFHYSPKYNKNILQIACSENGVNAETVETLLNLGATPTDTSRNGYQALHYAILKTDLEILNVVLKHDAVDVNAVAEGNNALHILIRHGKKESEDFLKCAEILLKKGINVNFGDKKNVSPILWACQRGNKDIIKLILECSPKAVDLDTHTLMGKTARELIQAQNLYDGELPKAIWDSNLDDGQLLARYLKSNKETEFINHKGGDFKEFLDYVDGGSTLLQISCEKKLTKAAIFLLENGADPSKSTAQNTKSPIEIAAERGYSDIFKALLEHLIDIPHETLLTLMMYIDDTGSNGINDYFTCYQLLMKTLKTQAKSKPDEVLLILNYQNQVKDTPLHYAIRYADQEIIEELLGLGASLGAKNRYGTMPVRDIEPQVLQKHLDNCILFDNDHKQLEKENFWVKYNYRSLIPPYATPNCVEVDLDDVEGNTIKTTLKRELVAETEVIYYMSKSPEFKHLLKHPVIMSFLYIKWLRIQWLFWTNLGFYALFTISLITYIFSDYAYISNEKKASFHELAVLLSYPILVATLCVLMLRELFQICVSPKNYFKNFENYLEIALIIITALIVFKSNSSYGERKQLSSLSILLSAFELVLMLGQHPKLSTNVVMLRTVSFNFFKFLLWYSLLIIGFALSFYLLFCDPADILENAKIETVSNDTAGGETGDDNFKNPGKSIFKTIIMLTGEFDASDMKFDTFPITSKLIFIMFVFTIAIVLLNLLNGLAVSDTQMIKTDAELVGSIARAQHIQYVETMLLGNILPVNIMQFLKDICCCLPIPEKWNNRLWHPIARDACLFPHYLNYELEFYPNKSGLVSESNIQNKSVKKNCAPCSVYLDKKTVKRTKVIIKTKIDELNSYGDANSKKIEKALETINQKIDDIIKRLNSLQNDSSSRAVTPV